MASNENIVLRAEHLNRHLDGEVPVQLITDANLSIRAGDFVCIMGPSGSGKSSLLYLLGLLDRPTSGKIWLNAIDTASLSDEQLARQRLSHLGYVFQFHFLLPEFTALDNVALPMRKLRKLSAEQIAQRAFDLLAQLGIRDQALKLPHQLSGGQRQRVAIARALANDPQIILADEPTGNLDSASAANVKSILRDLSQSMKKGVIAVTHDAAFASGADYLIKLVDGQIQA